MLSRQRLGRYRSASSTTTTTGEILQDETVDHRIGQAFEAGRRRLVQATAPRSVSLGHPRANRSVPEDWKKIDDILDVWFEAARPIPGSCAIPQKWPICGSPPACISKGSDQHRGWFTLAARKLRHQRLCALCERSDPRLHPRRRGARRCRNRWATPSPQGRHQTVRRRYPAASGFTIRLCDDLRVGGTSIHSTVINSYSQAAQHHALASGQSRALQARRSGGRCRHA